MLKKSILMASVVFFLSCAPSMDKLLQVKMGMDREQVVGILGEPHRLELSTGNWKTLHYGSYWFLFDGDDKLKLIEQSYAGGGSSSSFMGVVSVVQ